MNMRSAVDTPTLIACMLAAVCCLSAGEPNPDEHENSGKSAGDPMSGRKVGETRDDNGLKMKLVWCPPGTFLMENVLSPAGPDVSIEDQSSDDEFDSSNPQTDGPPPQKRLVPVKVFLSRGY